MAIIPPLSMETRDIQYHLAVHVLLKILNLDPNTCIVSGVQRDHEGTVSILPAMEILRNVILVPSISFQH